MSDKKHGESLFDSVNKLGDTAKESVRDANKPHGIIDAVEQMGNSARESVVEANPPHGLMDAVNRMADSARHAVDQSHEQTVVEGGGKSSGGFGEQQRSASNAASNAGDAFAQAARNNQAQPGGTPYGADSSSTTPGGVDQWIHGDDTEFHGSGGVGSAEYMQALREGHERAGGDYNSQMHSADEMPNTKDENA